MFFCLFFFLERNIDAIYLLIICVKKSLKLNIVYDSQIIINYLKL